MSSSSQAPTELSNTTSTVAQAQNSHSDEPPRKKRRYLLSEYDSMEECIYCQEKVPRMDVSLKIENFLHKCSSKFIPSIVANNIKEITT